MIDVKCLNGIVLDTIFFFSYRKILGNLLRLKYKERIVKFQYFNNNKLGSSIIYKNRKLHSAHYSYLLTHKHC